MQARLLTVAYFFRSVASMNRPVLHPPALKALVALSFAAPRWRNQSELAAYCGFVPSVVSNAIAGRRGLSDDSLDALTKAMADVTGEEPAVFRDAVMLPWRAMPADARTNEVVRELRRTQDALTSLTLAVMTDRPKS